VLDRLSHERLVYRSGNYYSLGQAETIRHAKINL
jgi:hypothetical protein